MIFRNKKQVDRIRSYRNVFNSEDGKRVLYDLMKLHHIFGPLPSNDVNEIIRGEGERNVVLRIMSLIQIDPIELENRLKAGAQTEKDFFTEE